MSIIKNITGEKPFEVLPRELLQQCDKKRKNQDSKPLSLQAIGLLCNLQSYPEDWEIHKTELYKRYEKNGRRQIENAWNELVDSNYVVQFRIYNGNKLDYCYYFSVQPITEDQIKELERKHNSESLKRLAPKSKESTVKNSTVRNSTAQNEQYRHDGVSSAVQTVQHNLYSRDVSNTKRTDNIIHNQHNTQEHNTQKHNTHHHDCGVGGIDNTEFKKVINYYNQEINEVQPFIKEMLWKDFNNCNFELIMYALEQTVINGKNSYNYFKGVLNNLNNRNISNIQDAKNYDQNLKSNRRGNTKSIELTPDWLSKRNIEINEDTENEEDDPEFIRERKAFLEDLEQTWKH